MEKQVLMIANRDDRRQIMAILGDNGYTVCLGKIKVGKTVKTVVEFSKEDTRRRITENEQV